MGRDTWLMLTVVWALSAGGARAASPEDYVGRWEFDGDDAPRVAAIEAAAADFPLLFRSFARRQMLDAVPAWSFYAFSYDDDRMTVQSDTNDGWATPLDGSPVEVTNRSGDRVTLRRKMVDGVLNDSLPALPIPSFELPDSLMTYDIPPGTELGLQSPLLENEPQHFVLRGDFGSL